MIGGVEVLVALGGALPWVLGGYVLALSVLAGIAICRGHPLDLSLLRLKLTVKAAPRKNPPQ